MKKIYVVLVLCLAAISSVQAQRKVGAAHSFQHLKKTSEFVTNGIQGAGCDTIIPFPDTSTLTYYTFDGGASGFLSGTNSTGDRQKADFFDFSATNYNYITGTAVYFAVANNSIPADSSKFIYFRVYADDNGTVSTEIGTPDSIPLFALNSDVNGGFLTAVNFTTPIALPASKKFYVSVDFSNLSYNDGDSLAIYSTVDGYLPADSGKAWEQWDDLSWHSFITGENQNVTLAILPFVSTTETACEITLPVKLISFDAARKNKDAIINWKAAEESNMNGYQLEKADNNNNYKPVTFIKAHNDFKNNFYTYTDVNAFANASAIQYRLKQIDGDGKITYSKIVSLKAGAAINNVVFANPFNGSLRLQLNLANASEISINIYDMKGNLVGSEKPATYNGTTNSIEVKSAAALNRGMYILRVMAGNEQQNYKIIKQ